MIHREYSLANVTRPEKNETIAGYRRRTDLKRSRFDRIDRYTVIESNAGHSKNVRFKRRPRSNALLTS